MRTIEAYGYEVTGSEEIIQEIEKDLNDPKTRINWNNFSNGNRLWNHDGDIGYPVEINHIKKTVRLL